MAQTITIQNFSAKPLIQNLILHKKSDEHALKLDVVTREKITASFYENHMRLSESYFSHFYVSAGRTLDKKSTQRNNIYQSKKPGEDSIIDSQDRT